MHHVLIRHLNLKPYTLKIEGLRFETLELEVGFKLEG